MYKIFLFTALLASLSNKALSQQFSKNNFINTFWFSENIDSMFFKSDTVKWVLYKNKAPDWAGKSSFAEDPVKLFGHGRYVKLHLKSRGKMEFWQITWHIAALYISGNWKWKFSTPENVIKLYYNNKLAYLFRPFSRKDINIHSKFNDGLLTTSEVQFEKLNNFR